MYKFTGHEKINIPVKRIVRVSSMLRMIRNLSLNKKKR
jgi:hypothetical protein